MKFNFINGISHDEPVDNNAAIIAFADAVNETHEAAATVADALVNLENFDEAFENLTNVLATIEQHGVSKGFMELIDGDSELSNAINTEIPTVVSGSNETQVATIATEGITDALITAYQTVKKFLVDLWKKIVIFFKSVMDRNKGILLKATSYKDGILKEELDEEAFGKSKMRILPSGDFDRMASGVTGLVDGMQTLVDNTEEADFDYLETEFKSVGYITKGNKVSKNEKAWDLKTEELKKLGYSTSDVAGVLDSCIGMVKQMRRLDELQKKMDSNVKAAVKGCDDLRSVGEAAAAKKLQKEIDVTKKNLAIFAKATSKITSIQYTLCSMGLNLAAKVKKAKNK